MENDETKAAQAVDHHGLVGRLLKMLDYVLNKDDSEELKLEITISGANWETDEDDEIGEYPPTLTDTVPLVIEESSTTDELCSETFDREELEDIRRRLSANVQAHGQPVAGKTEEAALPVQCDALFALEVFAGWALLQRLKCGNGVMISGHQVENPNPLEENGGKFIQIREDGHLSMQFTMEGLIDQISASWTPMLTKSLGAMRSRQRDPDPWWGPLPVQSMSTALPSATELLRLAEESIRPTKTLDSSHEESASVDPR